jgi:hypothetical protein
MKAETRGAALLMVVFILGAMALLATPFLIAMTLQEKASRGYLAASQARAGATGARNYAVTQLLRSHEYREAHGGEAPFNTPEYDTFEEVAVPLDGRRTQSRRGKTDVSLASFFTEGVTNPRGMIWGLETQDEQGKLDWRSVPDYVAARLVGAVREAGADPLNYFTRHAVAPAAWIAPQNIRHAAGGQVCVDDRTFFLEGSRVRISDGARFYEGRVATNRDNVPACAECGRIPMTLSITGGSVPPYGWIEVGQRHPLNLNTARRETIAAAFEGLRIRRGTQEISREEAYQIAQRLIERPILGELDFVKFLGELRAMITDEEIAAVALNARAPTHLSLHHTEMVQQANPNNPNQPIWNEEWHDPHGTVPFTWKTENVYTVEAAGARNSPAATVIAETRFREIVSVAPPERLRWVLETQQDFENFLQSDGFSQMNHSDTTRGYPFGNKVVTYPARLWLRSQDLPFGEFPGSGGGLANGAPGNPPRGVRPIPAKDRRRVNGGTGWSNHFTDPQSGAEGRLLTGALDQPVTGTNLLETNTNRTTEMRTFFTEEMHTPGQRTDRFDIRTGGIEFWFKTTGGGDAVLFDIADRDWESRLVCYVRGGEIVLRACDATIERKAAEVRGRVSLQADTWYHLGAYWDSTKLGGLALFIDGHPVAPVRPAGGFAHVDDQDRPIIAELSASLSPTDTTVGITNGGQFPPTGVIQVGTEAIEYGGSSGSSFTNCVRGTRRTAPDPDGKPTEGLTHAAGTKVSLYGYANPLDNVRINVQWGDPVQSVDVVLDRIPAARAILPEGFGINTDSTYISKKLPNPMAVPPEPGGISETDTTIEVFPTGPVIPPAPIPAPSPPINGYDTTDFPSRGFLKIGSEVISYAGKTATSFTGCQRGQLGTTAARHGFMSRIELFGFPAGAASGFPLPASLIQIDDEWFGPCMLNNGCFTGLIQAGVPDRLRRAWRFTVRQAHAAGAKVIPVFAVTYPYCGSEDFALAMPANRDLVTIVDRTGTIKEERRIRVVRNKRKGQDPTTGNWNWIWTENLVGLEDFVTQDFVQDKPYARLLKFPSGELLTHLPASLSIGGSQAGLGGAGGGGGGRGGSGGLVIDELRYYVAGSARRATATADQNRLLTAAEVFLPVTATADTIQLLNTANLPLDGGLVVLGNEIVAYREFVNGQNGQPGELRKCERGFLGTTAAVHDAGDAAFYLGMIPVGFLASPLSATSAFLSFSGAPRGFASEGYVLVDNEVIGSIRARTNAMGMFEMEMPADRRGEGVLRGRYGTVAAGHANEAVVVGIPFRYWDRFKPRCFDSQMAHYGISKTVIGATWKSLAATLESADKSQEVVVQARFDSRPAWDATPSSRPGGLYEFAGGGSGGLEVTADQIEVRVLFGYKGAAYFPNHAWKRAPTLSRLVIEYEQPTKTLYHEER